MTSSMPRSCGTDQWAATYKPWPSLSHSKLM